MAPQSFVTEHLAGCEALGKATSAILSKVSIASALWTVGWQQLGEASAVACVIEKWPRQPP